MFWKKKKKEEIETSHNPTEFDLKLKKLLEDENGWNQDGEYYLHRRSGIELRRLTYYTPWALADDWIFYIPSDKPPVSVTAGDFLKKEIYKMLAKRSNRRSEEAIGFLRKNVCTE